MFRVGERQATPLSGFGIVPGDCAAAGRASFPRRAGVVKNGALSFAAAICAMASFSV